jgi:hypothetical protein
VKYNTFLEVAELSKRIFISFAVEDVTYRDFLVGQARLKKSPFDFFDFSVKQPWDSQWKTNCRSRVKGCDGLVALVSKNTANAAGQLWEIQCADDDGVPVMLMWINDDRPAVPKLLQGRRINIWSWDNLKNFVDSL